MEFAERDITREELFSLLEDSTDIITRIDHRGIITFVSPASKLVLGYKPEELLGKSFVDLIHSDDVPAYLERIEQMKRGSRKGVSIARTQKNDGSYVHLETIWRSVTKPDKNFYIQGSSRDISYRIILQNQIEKRYSLLEDEVSKKQMIEESLNHQFNFRNSIINHSHIGISAMDRNFIFMEWNAAMEKMTGLPASQVIGRSWKDLYRKHIGTSIYNDLLRVYEGETIEIRNKPFASREGFHNSTMIPLYSDNGAIIGILTLTHDVSNETLLNEKLSEHESFLKKVTQTTPNIITVIDLKEDKIIFANKAFYRLYALINEDLTNKNFEDIFLKVIHPEDVPSFRKHIRFLSEASDNEELEQEYRLISINDQVRWFNIKSVVFKRDKEGRVIQLLTNAKEITKRKKAEQELIRNRDLLYQAQKIAKLGVWEWDIERDQFYLSDEFDKIYGSNQSEVGISLVHFIEPVHPEDSPGLNAVFTDAVFRKQSFTHEYRVYQPDGKIRYMQIQGQPKSDIDGKLIQIFGSCLDITELRDTEALLKKKEEFLSIASHELKTPLTTAKAYIELVKKMTAGTADESLINYINRTAIHIDKLTKLISDLLDISKIQSGKMQFDIKPFDLDSMLKENIENLQATVLKHQIFLKGKTGITIKGDKERLGQVISNLISNAIKYSPNADEVTISVKVENNEVLISVADKGIGISKENQDKIFDRFFRVDSKRGHFQGLGIGLFITKQIIHRHHGRIWVESEADKGSTFIFSLPVS